MLLGVQQLFYGLVNGVEAGGGLKACHYLSFLVDKKFGEVPFYVGLLSIVGIGLAQHLFQHGGEFVIRIKTLKALLFLMKAT